MSRSNPKSQASLTPVEGVKIEDIAAVAPGGTPVKKMKAVAAKGKKPRAQAKPKAQAKPMTRDAARALELKRQIAGFENLKASHQKALNKLGEKNPRRTVLEARIWHRNLCLKALGQALAAFEA